MRNFRRVSMLTIAVLAACLAFAWAQDQLIKVDQMPSIDKYAEPIYPADAKTEGIEGDVMVRVFVDSKGTAAKVEIVESSGALSLDEAAVNAARNTVFKPALKDGKPVSVWVTFKIKFALDEKKKG